MTRHLHCQLQLSTLTALLLSLFPPFFFLPPPLSLNDQLLEWRRGKLERQMAKKKTRKFRQSTHKHSKTEQMDAAADADTETEFAPAHRASAQPLIIFVLKLSPCLHSFAPRLERREPNISGCDRRGLREQERKRNTPCPHVHEYLKKKKKKRPKLSFFWILHWNIQFIKCHQMPLVLWSGRVDVNLSRNM